VDIALLVLVGLVVLVGIWLWSTYNALVALNVRVDEAWSDITVQLKRRADLIPNLIETVKGYAAYEGKVFEEVTKARAATVSPEALAHPEQAAAAENMLQGALKSLFAVAEAYPQLQAELTDTEDKIMASRRFYNGGVRELNTKVLQFPQNFFAKGLGFPAREFFEVADAANISEPPKASF
jgi:LemA protein